LPATSPVPLLRVENLSKTFHGHGGAVRAISDVSFEVVAGKTVALVGESGCGKSTTARCLVRLTEPTSGRVLFRGRDITSISLGAFRPIRRDMQMVFQDSHASLNPSFTIRRTLREPLQLHAIARGPAVERELHELMRLVQLEPAILDRHPDQLSGGQRQRIGIARAIATRPAFVVLDEPTSSLDMSLRLSLLELLTDLQRQLGMTYVFITHDFSTVRYLAHRVEVMYLGRVVESGTVDEVLGAPLHPYTRGLIAAIPVPEPGRRRRHTQLAGEAPDAATVGPGCAFQDRCPNVMSECRLAPIPTIRIGAREVACLLYGGPAGMVQAQRDGAPFAEGDGQPAVAGGGATVPVSGQGGA
jgi:oligopeptide/dipeptide ABC transporter ATP-binding protein